MIPSNACTLRITAAAGTELAGAFLGGTVRTSFLPTVLYDPKAFITHAAWLGQACAHCPIFLTAASRRSLVRVPVPVWLIILSDQLPVFALVSRYLTNKLMGRRLILWWCFEAPLTALTVVSVVLRGISIPFGMLSPAKG